MGAMALGGCASLTKSQLNEVNAFGLLTSNFERYPGKVVSTLNEVHATVQLYQVNTVQNPKTHLAMIREHYDNIRKTEQLDSSMNIAFHILSDYGQKLVQLTSDDYTRALDTAGQNLGTNLDGMIEQYNKLQPDRQLRSGIGALFGQLVVIAGDSYIRSKQAEATKRFVARGDTLVSAIALNMDHFLGGSNGHEGRVYQAILKEREHLVASYQAYLQRNGDPLFILKGKDTVYTGTVIAWHASGFESDRLFITSLQNLDAEETLRRQCLEAVRNLRKAHARLLADLQNKKSLKEIYTELRAYGGSVGEMNATTKKIK